MSNLYPASSNHSGNGNISDSFSQSRNFIHNSNNNSNEEEETLASRSSIAAGLQLTSFIRIPRKSSVVRRGPFHGRDNNNNSSCNSNTVQLPPTPKTETEQEGQEDNADRVTAFDEDDQQHPLRRRSPIFFDLSIIDPSQGAPRFVLERKAFQCRNNDRTASATRKGFCVHPPTTLLLQHVATVVCMKSHCNIRGRQRRR